jgi:hypothetical protein
MAAKVFPTKRDEVEGEDRRGGRLPRSGSDAFEIAHQGDGAVAVVFQFEKPSGAIERLLANAGRHDVTWTETV